MTGPWIRLESPIGNLNSCGRGRKILYYIQDTRNSRKSLSAQASNQLK